VSETVGEREALRILSDFGESMETTDEWIPVSERLPGDIAWVLVVAADPHGGGPEIDIGIVEGEGWCSWLGPVTHWMPLPPLPVESSDE